MPDAPQPTHKKEEYEEETPSDLEEAAQEEPEDTSEPPSAQIPKPQRRRAKRRVMKKRTFKDTHGYIVTKEEPVWESFSEDEPEREVKQQKKSTTTAPAAATGAKGAGTKTGQGSIMSFFGKK